MRKEWRIRLLVILLLAGGVELTLWPHMGGDGVLLWEHGAPAAQGDEREDRPTLEIFLPPSEKATGTAVVICPGGGYTRLGLNHEGKAVARWLNGLGIAAFVLEYRLAPRYHYPVQVEDAMRAMRFVRYHKTEYGLVSDHIGIMGFSAGGHLAALVATESGQAPVTHSDAIDEVSARPDFAILGYPVITLLAPYAHEGSVNGLLGPSASPEARSALSAERRVTAATPPVFLFTTSDDKVVPSENSALFYLALKKAGVPAELHIFAHGVHGMGLANGRDGTPDAHALAVWTALAQQWMDGLGLPQKPSGGHH